MIRPFVLLSSVSVALADTLIWDGRLNGVISSTELTKWSWSNQVGPYQYYIVSLHQGPSFSAIEAYVNLDPKFKNPGDPGSSQGIKITLDDTSFWNGQTMRRTELIPQTKAAINAGKVYYHFSMSRKSENPLNDAFEHQIAFFENHFTEMKCGWGNGTSDGGDPYLRWVVNGTSKWTKAWAPDVWHNFAYGIDFDAKTVEFFHSSGGDPLVPTITAVPAEVKSDGKDWHVGVLQLPRHGYKFSTEDFYFSGVYIESGDITLNIGGPGVGIA
ncbi:hypothetical protein B2J93_7899 [Marssonina coronariae]|uniref:Glycoside hydrolase 131 catalytic N-terminal domain-containing protein n=1 Tax=Diplocarpon coronariae TaxID=2795749 RepID=A0A218ZE51_9HELO|nr:hypothetical protein B2J93_7899 [Marssonina coronariae]